MTTRNILSGEGSSPSAGSLLPGEATLAERMSGPIADERRLEMLFDALMEIEDERGDLNARASALRAAAKACGFDSAVLTEVVRRARKDPEALAERDIMIANYAEALGQLQGVANPGAGLLIAARGHDPAAVGKRRSEVEAVLAWAGEGG